MEIAVCSIGSGTAGEILDLLAAMEEKYKIPKNALRTDCFGSMEALVHGKKSYAVFFLEITDFGEKETEAVRGLLRQYPSARICLLAQTAAHCLKGYDLGADGYLLMPAAQDKFEHFFLRRMYPQIQSDQTLDFYSGRRKYNLPVRKILYIESLGRKCLIHTGLQVYSTNMALRAIEKDLAGDAFLRCHRSYLVNLSHVREILDSDILLNNGVRVPLALRNHGRILQTWQSFQLRTEKH